MDLDADGDQDLLSVSFSNNSVKWFANDGLGNFSISDDEDTEVITIDTNQDGTADEIQMRYNDQFVSWFRTTEEHFTTNTTLDVRYLSTSLACMSEKPIEEMESLLSGVEKKMMN